MRDYLEGWKETAKVKIPPAVVTGFSEPVLKREYIEPVPPAQPESPQKKDKDEEKTVFLGDRDFDGDAPTVLLRREPLLRFYVKRLKTGETVEILKSPFVIGKSSASDYTVRGNATVSRSHARISRTQEGWFLEDLQSLNHTFAEGRQIDGPVRLVNETVFKLSDEEFQFLVEVGKK